MDEYNQIIGIINSFDDRLLIIKGWAVTFTLATLVVAIQKKADFIIAVVILSSISFWILEAETKLHQTKYYPRMRAIEISLANLNGGLKDEKNDNEGNRCFSLENKDRVYGPLIDWSWEHAENGLPDTLCARRSPSRLEVYFYPHVAIPHSIIILFSIGWFWLNPRGKEGSRIQLLSLRKIKRK